MCKQFRDDIRGPGKTTNGILSKTKTKNSISHFFRDGHNIITNKLLIVNFNSMFIKIGSILFSEIGTHIIKSVKFI